MEAIDVVTLVSIWVCCKWPTAGGGGCNGSLSEVSMGYNNHPFLHSPMFTSWQVERPNFSFFFLLLNSGAPESLGTTAKHKMLPGFPWISEVP
jgi:hypothetical protein